MVTFSTTIIMAKLSGQCNQALIFPNLTCCRGNRLDLKIFSFSQMGWQCCAQSITFEWSFSFIVYKVVPAPLVCKSQFWAILFQCAKPVWNGVVYHLGLFTTFASAEPKHINGSILENLFSQVLFQTCSCWSSVVAFGFSGFFHKWTNAVLLLFL